jgi:fatty-acyl-CoA synthase
VAGHGGVLSQPPLAPREIVRISDTVRYHAIRTPGREAVVFGSRRISYGELDRLVESCAKALLACGIVKGDRVAQLMTSRPEYLVVFLATARIGALWLGLNPRYRLDELRYIVGDSRPALLFGQALIGDRDYQPELETLAAEQASLARVVLLGGEGRSVEDDFARFIAVGKEISDERLAAATEEVAPMDAALVVYTSGSTGRPKGALISHHGLVHCSKVQGEQWRTREPVRILCNFPINHVACTGDICSWVLVAGGAIVFMETFDPAATLDAIERERLNVWGGVPTMLQLCVGVPDFDRRDLSSIEFVLWSGAASPRPLLDRLSRLGAKLATSYGMTETTGSVTYSDPGADLDTLAETIGRPHPAYEVRLAGEDGRPCPVGEEGEIQVRGDFIMLGYYDRPEATAAAIDADGWLHTGDVAVAREDGNWRIVGRRSQMYKSGGFNVYPREIELALEGHPAVAMATVVPLADPLYQEVGCAFVVPRGDAEPSEDELRQFLRERLANYKVPKRLFVRRELPMLPVGKVDRVRLTADAARMVGHSAGAS